MDETTLTVVLAAGLMLVAFTSGSLLWAGLGAAAFLIPLSTKNH